MKMKCNGKTMSEIVGKLAESELGNESPETDEDKFLLEIYRAGIRHHEDYVGKFAVTYVTRSDIAGHFSELPGTENAEDYVDGIFDGDMSEIADRMEGVYLESGLYWDSLEAAAEPIINRLKRETEKEEKD